MATRSTNSLGAESAIAASLARSSAGPVAAPRTPTVSQPRRRAKRYAHGGPVGPWTADPRHSRVPQRLSQPNPRLAPTKPVVQLGKHPLLIRAWVVGGVPEWDPPSEAE